MNAEASRTVADAEALLFDEQLRTIRTGFQLRRPDAMERARTWLDGIDGQIVWTQKVCKARMRTVSEVAMEAERRITDLQQRRSRLAAVIEEHKNKNLQKGGAEDLGPTAETASRPARVEPVKMLWDRGHIEIAEYGAALEIAEIFEACQAALFARIGRYGDSGGAPKHSYPRQPNIPEHLAKLHSAAYLPWAAAMEVRWPRRMGFVIAIVVDGRAIDVVREDAKVGWDTMLRQLRESLGLYVDMRPDDDELDVAVLMARLERRQKYEEGKR